MFVFLAVSLFILMVIAYRNRHGVKLQEVAVSNIAASHGEDYIETKIGGCRLRYQMSVKVRLAPVYSRKRLGGAIMHQALKINPRTTAVCYNGTVYRLVK